MTEGEGESPVPHIPLAWIGQEVHVLNARAAGPDDSINCTLREVNELGIAVVADERPSFIPWSTLIRIDLGHEPEPRRRTTARFVP